MPTVTDILLVGAGPTGLHGAYCAGFRGLRTVVVDGLPQPGGQIAALYPEKEIRDVAGIPGLRGAVDWALALRPVARTVTVVHRRAAFRAHAASVTELTGCEDVARVLEVDSVIAALGFVSNLGPLGSRGLSLNRRSIVVDSRMRTNLERVYAAGDVTEYAGKVRLMSVGFGEVATAVNNAAVELDPELSLFPGHSTEKD